MDLDVTDRPPDGVPRHVRRSARHADGHPYLAGPRQTHTRDARKEQGNHGSEQPRPAPPTALMHQVNLVRGQRRGGHSPTVRRHTGESKPSGAALRLGGGAGLEPMHGSEERLEIFVDCSGDDGVPGGKQ